MTNQTCKLDIKGHSRQRNALARLVQNDRLPSALLFAGPEGVGKRLVALELARQLVCEQAVNMLGGCANCKSCVLFAAGNYPDLIQRDCSAADQVDADTTRELVRMLQLKTFSGRARIVILDNAESLPDRSANILLKSLEEPPLGTHFILISSNVGALISTVVSRCQQWHFGPLLADQIAEIFAGKRFGAVEHGLSNDELIALADGSCSGIEEILDDTADWREVCDQIDCIVAGDSDSAIVWATALSKARSSLRKRLRLMRIYARQRLLRESEVEKCARFAVFLSNCLAAERLLFERNLNAGLVLTNMLLSLVASDGAGLPKELLPYSSPLIDQMVV